MFSKLKVRTILTRVFGPLEPGENAIGIDVSPEELEAIFVRLSGDDRLKRNRVSIAGLFGRLRDSSGTTVKRKLRRAFDCAFKFSQPNWVVA